MEFVKRTVNKFEETLHIRRSNSVSDGSEGASLDGSHYDSEASGSDDEEVCMLCSFAATGPNSAYQSIFQCITCMGEGSEALKTNECCCIGCADACHAGHDVRYIGFGMGYCDCGAKGCAWLETSNAGVEQEVFNQAALSSGTGTDAGAAAGEVRDSAQRRNLTVFHDSHGRIAGTDESGLRVPAFREFDWAALTDEAASVLERQAEVLTAHSKDTFWLGAEAEPRCALEAAAKCVFDHYTAGLIRSSSISSSSQSRSKGFDPSISGAEWWVQVKPLVPVPPGAAAASSSRGGGEGGGKERGGVLQSESSVRAMDASTHGRASSWWDRDGSGCSSAAQAAAIDLHYDKDEWIAEHFGIGVYPQISTVTYLTDARSAGTHSGESGMAFELPSPTLVFSHKAWDDVGKPISDVYVSRPRRGKHICFDGRYLHGAPSHPLLKQDPFAADTRGPEAAGDDTEEERDLDLTVDALASACAGIAVSCSTGCADIDDCNASIGGLYSASAYVSTGRDEEREAAAGAGAEGCMDVEQHASRSAAFPRTAAPHRISTGRDSSHSVYTNSSSGAMPRSLHRVTFLVNVWLGHRPVGVHPLPEDIVAVISPAPASQGGGGMSTNNSSDGNSSGSDSSSSSSYATAGWRASEAGPMDEVESPPVVRILAPSKVSRGSSSSSSARARGGRGRAGEGSGSTCTGTASRGARTAGAASSTSTPRSPASISGAASTYVFEEGPAAGGPWLRLPFVSADSTWGGPDNGSTSDVEIVLRMYLPKDLVFGAESVLINEDTCHLVYASEEVQLRLNGSGGEDGPDEENSVKVPLRSASAKNSSGSPSSDQAVLTPLVSLVYEYSDVEVPIDDLE
jgi:hypothetical protein